MRIAKKVLAIVLAIVMVVGSFVIATSAADDKKIYLSLKAQVMTGTGASQSEALKLDTQVPSTIRASAFSKQTTDINTYKSTSSTLAYHDSSEVITVNPGDMVWITTSLKSVGGVYPDAIQGQVFYDTNVFTSVASLVTNTYIWNANNELYKHSNSTLSGGVIYGRATQDFRDEYTPADFDDAMDAQYNQYTWFSAVDPGAVMANEEFPEMVAAQNSDLVTFPVYVRTDAPAGATAKIFTYNYAKLSGTYLPASDYSAEFDMGDIYESPIGYGPEMFDLTNAVLTFKVAGGEAELDYEELNAQIADYEGRDADAYTAETWEDATAAYNTAKALVDAAESQDDIDNAANALKAALAALEAKPVLNYDGINAAIASVPADLSTYTTSTASAVSTALANAESVKASATTQGELDNAATALNNAVTALEAKANFNNLDSALDEAKDIVNEGYTAETWARLQNAIAVAEAFDRDETGVSQQPAVTAAADELFEAIDGLEKEVVLDYTAWNAAVAKIPANLEGYTPASVSAYEADKAAADAAFAAAVLAKDQTALDKAAADLEAAIALLTAVADKDALKAAIDDTPEYAADMYSNWDAYAAALEAANTVYADPNASADAVANATAALVDAKGALTVAPADYTAVENAKDSVPADLSAYTADSAKAVNDAVAAVVYGKLKTEQEAVNAMAKAIVDAVEALERLADYTAVEDAIDAIPADLSIYTDETVKAVNDAVAAVVYGLGETQQDVVNGYAADINTAVGKLAEKDADYSAVTEALGKVKALNRALYTEASLADVDYAVSQVVEGKKISEQESVNAMAAAINEALDNLKLKPTEGYVQEVAATDVPYATNTFTIKVEGRPNKIRFVDCDNNALTWTFTREAARNAGSIVSYNADGEVVHDLSREIAYEIWTIDVVLVPGAYYVNVKDNDGWEDLSLSYIYEVKYSADDKAVNSAEAEVTEANVGDMVKITVKTGADVLKVQTVSNGSVATYGNPVVADGVATFEVYAKVYLEGENTITFNVKTADGWEAADASVVITGVVAE